MVSPSTCTQQAISALAPSSRRANTNHRFYNTTYTIFAASIILVYISQEASEVEIQPLLKLVTMAIEVLETMADDCVVAGQSAKFLQKALERAAATRHQKDSERLAGTLMSMSSSGNTPSHVGGQQQQHNHHHHHHHGGQGYQQTSNSGMLGGSAALTPAESDHGGGGGGGGGAAGGGAAPWMDPGMGMGISWMHCWAPVNLLESETMDFDLNMPFMGFEGSDISGSRPN